VNDRGNNRRNTNDTAPDADDKAYYVEHIAFTVDTKAPVLGVNDITPVRDNTPPHTLNGIVYGIYNDSIVLDGTIEEGNFWYMTIKVDNDGESNEFRLTDSSSIISNPLTDNLHYTWTKRLDLLEPNFRANNASKLEDGQHTVTITVYDLQ